MGKCKFRTDWLLKKDRNGHLLSAWASKHSATEVFCKLCMCTIDFQNKGCHALLQHSDYAKHKKIASDVLGSKQMVLVAANPGDSSGTIQSEETGSNHSSSVPIIKLYSSKNAATVSELIWVMKSVCCNFSASSCSGMKETFNAMFPGGVPADFSLSPKKMRYLVTDALGPYFQQMISDDVGTSLYSVCFDETTNVEDKKELQISVRYWSERRGEVLSRHLQTFFIGKADAQTLHGKIHSAISNSNLPLNKLMMIGSDGPNVNKKVRRLLNEDLIEMRSRGLVDIGTCPIHIVHNAYLKALQTFGEDASELAVAVYHYFDGWPARLEEYEKIQEDLKLPQKKFLKHSPSRWLTFGPAAERLLEQWEGVNHYFLKFLPSVKNRTVLQSTPYKKMANLLRCSTMKAQLYFTISSAELFTSFAEKFQRDEPLIHILYLQLQELLGKLARRVCKSVSVGNFDVNELFDSKNMLPLKEIVVSQEIKNELSCHPEKELLVFMNSAKEHYVVGCKYLIEKAMKNCDLIKALRCLNPSLVKNKQSCQDLVSVARELPIDIKEDVLVDEWKMLQMETGPAFEGRIDSFWDKTLKKTNVAGQKQYQELAKVIKAALCLSHGNADIERRFSVSRWVLTEDKTSTCERTLNAILTIKDTLKILGNKPELVPMTSKLIAMGQSAHKHYTMYLEEQRRVKEEKEKKKVEALRLATETEEKVKQAEESRKKISEIESKISQTKQDHEASSEAYDHLFKEANERLKRAIQNGNLKEVSVAQGMLEGVKMMRETEKQKLKEVETLRKTVEKRKNSLITNFFDKKHKSS